MSLLLLTNLLKSSVTIQWKFLLAPKLGEPLQEDASNHLTFLSSLRNSNQRLMRWVLFLDLYKLSNRHIRGSDNIMADALSHVLSVRGVYLSTLCSPGARISWVAGVREGHWSERGLCVRMVTAANSKMLVRR